MRRFIILISLLLVFTGIFAQEVLFEQSNDVPNPLKVMYPFSVKVKFDKNFSYLKANLVDDKDIMVADQESLTASSTDSLVVKLVATRTGLIEVAPIKLLLFDEIGTDTLLTSPFKIDVIALTDSTSVITDIKTVKTDSDPLTLKSNFDWLTSWTFWIIVISAILLLIIGFIIYRKWDYIRSLLVKTGILEDDEVLPVWDLTIQELLNIKQRMLLTETNKYKFSIEESLVIRRFLEGYYNFPAAEKTTLELKNMLTKYRVKEGIKIIDILQKLDIIKYTEGKQDNSNFKSEDIHAWFSKYVSDIKKYEESKEEKRG